MESQMVTVKEEEGESKSKDCGYIVMCPISQDLGTSTCVTFI